MRHFVCVLALFAMVATVYALPVTPDQAQMVGKKAAESLWGPLNSLQSQTLLKPDGTISAYAFIFGRHGVSAIDESVILAGYNLRQMGQIDAGWDLARAPQDYCYAILAADNNYGPILEMCDGLPSFLIFREDVKDLGEATFGADAQIANFYYLFPLEDWYGVTNGQESVYVYARRGYTVSSEIFTSFPTVYDYPGNPTSPNYWNRLLSSSPPSMDNSAYIGGVPNYNQSEPDNCGPHSAAQLLGYWDNHTYGGQGPWDLLIDTDFWALEIEMRTPCGWYPGCGGVYNYEVRDGIETVANDPAYNNNYSFDAVMHSYPAYSVATSALDGGRPGVVLVNNHPTYGNHFMTVVGYNDSPSQTIQVHDNIAPSNDEPIIAWDATCITYIDVFPGGGGSVTPIVVSDFSGKFRQGNVDLTWTVASEAECYGYNVLRDGVVINNVLIRALGTAETQTYTLTDDGVQTGQTYVYALQSVMADGRTEIAKTITLKTLTYNLAQNVPNPFNPSTSIRYSVPEASFVALTVYDARGQRIAALVNNYQEADNYSVNFDASQLTSGIYFYRLDAGDSQTIRKMVLLK